MVCIAKARSVGPQAQNPNFAEVIAAAEQALAQVKGRRLITNQRQSLAQRRKRGQKLAGGWLHAPATWYPFKAGYQSLVQIARPEHLVDQKLQRIQAGCYEGDTRVYLWPTLPTDMDGIEVKISKKFIYMNLSNVLGDLGQLLPPNIKRRFDLLPADNDSPVQPALMIQLDKALDEKTLPKKKKKGQTAPAKAEQQSGAAPKS